MSLTELWNELLGHRPAPKLRYRGERFTPVLSGAEPLRSTAAWARMPGHNRSAKRAEARRRRRAELRERRRTQQCYNHT